MSASTTWPAVRTKPAPAPATKRAKMNSGNVPASAHQRLPRVETMPPIARVGLRPSRSQSWPVGMATTNRASP